MKALITTAAAALAIMALSGTGVLAQTSANLHAEITTGPFMADARTSAGDCAPGEATTRLTIKGELARAHLRVGDETNRGAAVVTEIIGGEVDGLCLVAISTFLFSTTFTATERKPVGGIVYRSTQHVWSDTSKVRLRQNVRQSVKDQVEQIATAILLAQQRDRDAEEARRDLRRDEYQQYLALERQRREREQRDR